VRPLVDRPLGVLADEGDVLGPEPGLLGQLAPRRRLGQVHRWFFFEPLDGDVRPTPDGREFGAWRWVHPDWLISQVVPFRRPGYSQVLGAVRAT